jgi:hypothetical protein
MFTPLTIEQMKAMFILVANENCFGNCNKIAGNRKLLRDKKK